MLHLTPDMLEHAYELLRVTPPFKSWKLPPGDDVAFCVVRMRKHQDQADWTHDGTRHVIRINAKKHGTLNSLLMTLAHEMCHMREYELGFRRVDVMHGELYYQLADAVCRHHTFDKGQFS